jgi:transposase
MWIADLLARGLIRSSFMPPGGAARPASFDAHSQTIEVAQHPAQIERVLGDANLKIISALSDVMG